MEGKNRKNLNQKRHNKNNFNHIRQINRQKKQLYLQKKKLYLALEQHLSWRILIQFLERDQLEESLKEISEAFHKTLLELYKMFLEELDLLFLLANKLQIWAEMG